MGTLDKVFDDLFAISKGDVATLTRATDEFVREVTQQNRMPLPPAVPAEPVTTEPMTTDRGEAARR